MESLVTERAAWERVLLLDTSTTGAVRTLDQYFIGQPHQANTVVELLTRQTHYHLFDPSHHTSEVDPFTREAAF